MNMLAHVTVQCHHFLNRAINTYNFSIHPSWKVSTLVLQLRSTFTSKPLPKPKTSLSKCSYRKRMNDPAQAHTFLFHPIILQDSCSNLYKSWRMSPNGSLFVNAQMTRR